VCVFHVFKEHMVLLETEYVGRIPTIRPICKYFVSKRTHTQKRTFLKIHKEFSYNPQSTYELIV
jgi:hypothetical protein